MPARIPMTQRQRAALLALPDSEAAVVRHYGLDAEDLAAIGTARTPATRLSYALQLCCLRFPGRSEEHTSELQSLMRISYAVFCLKKQNYQSLMPTTNVHKH